ncbi:MAG: hypothetical protein Q7T61_02200 [Caulobacter sp.]|nr:hypothetical protein [Caulobacter sp.]
MTPALRNALEEVYAELRSPTPARIDGCPCCIDRKTVGALHVRALGELTDEDLGAYAASVFLTVGDLADFRYFLPRILELAITMPSFSIGLEVVLGKLALADWKSWSRREQEAIGRVIDIWFDDVAVSCAKDWDGFDGTVDDLLCAIGRTGLDPIVYIERLLPEDRSFALNVLWEENRNSLRQRGRMTNAFWGDDAVHAAVVARLMADDIQAIVA